MSSTSLKSEIAEIIETELQPEAHALEQSAGEQKSRVQSIVNKLSDAIRASNQPLIKRELATLEEYRMGPYASLVTRTNVLLAKLARLRADDESGEDFTRIEGLTKSLGELQGKLERNYAALKGLEDKANDVLEAATAAGGDARKEWAAMEGWLKAQLEAAKLHLQAMIT